MFLFVRELIWCMQLALQKEKGGFVEMRACTVILGCRIQE